MKIGRFMTRLFKSNKGDVVYGSQCINVSHARLTLVNSNADRVYILYKL